MEYGVGQPETGLSSSISIEGREDVVSRGCKVFDVAEDEVLISVVICRHCSSHTPRIVATAAAVDGVSREGVVTSDPSGIAREALRLWRRCL